MTMEPTIVPMSRSDLKGLASSRESLLGQAAKSLTKSNRTYLVVVGLLAYPAILWIAKATK